MAPIDNCDCETMHLTCTVSLQQSAMSHSSLHLPLESLELYPKTSGTNNEQNLSSESNVYLEKDTNLNALSSHLLPPQSEQIISSPAIPLHENNSLLSKARTHRDKTTAFSKSTSLYADVNPPSVALFADNNSEVELVSLIEEKIPKYKLRFDTITEFTDYQHNDWFIKTPLIDLETPIDLNPLILRETLKYFIQSGERLSQMTKVYNDIDALTKLLEEKERDLELAAHIGQSLLDQNRDQNEKIEQLETDLTQAKEKIVQLKHEISSKKDLLQIYFKQDEDEDEELFSSLNDCSISSLKSPTRITQLEKRVGTLETENQKLKNETIARRTELESVERKELQLLDECTRQLTSANKQLATLQEDINKKNEENNRLQKEIDTLSNQVSQLDKQIRHLNIENEELESALSLAHECQSELSLELIDVKEKHNNLLIAFHDKQEECRQLIKSHSFSDSIFPYVDSLAYELEQSHWNGNNVSLTHLDVCDEVNFPVLESAYNHCTTPDSLLSNDSYCTNSPFVSFSGTATSLSQELNKSQSSLSSSTNASQSSTVSSTTVTSSTSKTVFRNHFMSDKLRYIKPIEGSQILNHWRRLASPNFSNLLEDKDKENYISRIKANLAVSEAKIASLSKDKLAVVSSTSTSAHSSQSLKVSLANNFVTTNSVYTFTTTSLSHTKESMTHVTSTFSNVQPSTGKTDFSLDTQSTHLYKRRRSLHDIKNVAYGLSTQTKTTQVQTGLATSSKVTDANNDVQIKSESHSKQDNGNSQLRLESLGGLNELTKLLEKESMDRFSVAKPLNQNRRIMTKVMANANDLTNLIKIAKSDFSQTDLSVLRNLRKGGLI